MKRVLSLILAVLTVTALSTLTVTAGNGPSVSSWTYGEETNYLAFLHFYKLDPKGYPAYDDEGEGTYYSVFSDNAVKNEMAGASYDRATNTLTLNNLDAHDFMLEGNMMGDDFKIRVVGECSLAGLTLWGDDWGNSVTFVGDGKLTVNELMYQFPSVQLIPEGAENAFVAFGPDVKVDMYSPSNVIGAFGVSGTDGIVRYGTAPEKPLVLEAEQMVESRYISYDVYFADSISDESYALVTRASDPDGIYAVRPTTWADGTKGYTGYKFLWIDSVGAYIFDKSFAAEFQSGYPFEVDFKNDSLIKSGFTLNKNGEGDLDWREFKVFNRCYSDSTLFTDGENSYAVAWIYDEEKGDSFPTAYRVEAIPGVEGVLIGKEKADGVDAQSLDFLIEELPVEGYFNVFSKEGEFHYNTSGSSGPAIGFKDVPSDAFYAEPVRWAVRSGITAGTSKTTFSPDDGCTRGQVVTFLWRSAGEPEPKGEKNPFVDVGESDYYYKAVMWAVENGITAGTSKTTFSPDDTCTRAQIVTFLWRAAGEPEPSSTTNPFKDVKQDDYFRRAVLWAVGRAITLGTSSNTFSPEDTCTRGQVVTFLYRSKTGMM
ncbi:MAG: S-layer homology domain-containing protein [Clostridia bacterium]|nr:S-layer homology domain-containing protein [Clostridia bacterium]